MAYDQLKPDCLGQTLAAVKLPKGRTKLVSMMITLSMYVSSQGIFDIY